MKRLVYIIFSSFLIFFSCAKQKPSGVLPEDKIVDLLTEVSLIDAYIQSLPMDSGRKVLPVLYDNLFKEFDIDSVQFKKNLDFYYGNPQLTEKIYTAVGEKLMGYEKNYRLEDSVRNVFVQDSIQFISRLQNLHSDRINLTMNFSKDTTDYTYKVEGQRFLNRNNLMLNAYGIQMEAIPTTVPAPMDSIATEVINDSIPKLDTIASDLQLPANKSNDKVRMKRVQDSIVRKNGSLRPLSKKL